MNQDLHAKIGQMLLVGFSGLDISAGHEIAQAIQTHHLGGVILFDMDYQAKTSGKNILDPQQVKKLTSQLISFANPDYPLFIAVDYEGGVVNRLKPEYGFPTLKGPAELAKDGIEASRVQARLMAKTLSSLGFNVDFAPLVDINNNPNNPIIGRLGRSYSEDANIVSKFAKVFIEEMHAQKILCSYKHFPGHGSSTGDSHLGCVDVTDTWHPDELIPYETLLPSAKYQDFVMTAHLVNRQLDDSGLPATLSKKVLTDLLRNELKFSGIIITDDMQMQAISDHYDPIESATLAINAGADMLIYGNQLAKTPQKTTDLVSMIAEQVENGVIKRERIDDAFSRIMSAKKTTSLTLPG